MRREIGKQGKTIFIIEPQDLGEHFGDVIADATAGSSTVILDLRELPAIPESYIPNIQQAYLDANENGKRPVGFLLPPDLDDATNQALTTAGLISWMPLYTPEEV